MYIAVSFSQVTLWPKEQQVCVCVWCVCCVCFVRGVLCYYVMFICVLRWPKEQSRSSLQAVSKTHRRELCQTLSPPQKLRNRTHAMIQSPRVWRSKERRELLKTDRAPVRTPVLSREAEGTHWPAPAPVARASTGAKDCTPESTPQKSLWVFSDMFQWMFSGIFQRLFTFQRYCPNAYHLPSGFYRTFQMDFQWHVPMESHFL